MKKSFIVLLSIILSSCVYNDNLKIDDYIKIENTADNREIGYEGGTVFITLNTNNDWFVECDYEWCHVVNTEGAASDNAIVKILCDENFTSTKRYATISVMAGETNETTYIIQNGINPDSAVIIGSVAYVNSNNAGNLYKMLYESINEESTETEWGNEIWGFIHEIYIYGNIDARDFNTMKWNLRNLETVDISNTKIQAYSGKYGTDEGYGMDYDENTIPCGWFFYWCANVLREFPEELYDEGNSSIKKVVLPDGIVNIRFNAFARAYNLTELNIPEGVETIGDCAFRYCKSIEKLYLPSTLKSVGWLCFTEMTSLKEVHIKAENMPSGDDLFGYYPDDAGGNRGWVLDRKSVV